MAPRLEEHSFQHLGARIHQIIFWSRSNYRKPPPNRKKRGEALTTIIVRHPHPPYMIGSLWATIVFPKTSAVLMLSAQAKNITVLGTLLPHGQEVLSSPISHEMIGGRGE